MLINRNYYTKLEKKSGRNNQMKTVKIHFYVVHLICSEFIINIGHVLK